MQDHPNILFIKWKSMGDVVFTLPAIHQVRQNFPSARITYMTSAENQCIAAGFTEIDEVVAVDRRVFKQRKPASVGAVLRLLRQLRRGRYSLVIDLQCYAETAAMACLTHARDRWGFQIGRRLRRLAYTKSQPRNDNSHPVDANLQLLAHCGLKPAEISLQAGFRLPETGRAEARDFLARNNIHDAAPALFIQPFTSSPHKNWPLDHQLQVASHWRSQGVRVIFGGGPQEREALQPVVAAGFPVCAGMPLSAVAWVVQRSHAILGGDTGLLHLANALGKRVVAVMATWGPGSCIPYRHPEWVISPTPGPPLATIGPEKINEALSPVLKKSEEVCAAR